MFMDEPICWRQDVGLIKEVDDSEEWMKFLRKSWIHPKIYDHDILETLAWLFRIYAQQLESVFPSVLGPGLGWFTLLLNVPLILPNCSAHSAYLSSAHAESSKYPSPSLRDMMALSLSTRPSSSYCAFEIWSNYGNRHGSVKEQRKCWIGWYTIRFVIAKVQRQAAEGPCLNDVRKIPLIFRIVCIWYLSTV